MSILSEKTERRAILCFARMLRHFGNLDFLMLSAEDAHHSKQAENLFRGIIETNGYKPHFRKGQTKILKQKY